ncbi:MAG: hypothetical protein ACFB9M_17010 [Myxococcota bacterium]
MSRRILIVDDDEATVSALEEALQRVGLASHRALSPAELAAALRAVSPSVVIVAARRPDALTLVHQVRQHPQGRQIPVLFVGDGGPGAAVQSPSEALEKGGDYFFKLPTDMDYLAGRIEGWASRSGIDAELDGAAAPEDSSGSAEPELSGAFSLEAFSWEPERDLKKEFEWDRPPIPDARSRPDGTDPALQTSMNLHSTHSGLARVAPARTGQRAHLDPTASPPKAPEAVIEGPRPDPEPTTDDLVRRSSSSSGQALLRDGQALWELGHVQEAMEALQTAAALFRADDEPQSTLDTHDLALQWDPSQAEHAHAGADIALELGQVDKACEMLERCAVALGDQADAKALWERLLRIQPECARYASELARLDQESPTPTSPPARTTDWAGAYSVIDPLMRGHEEDPVGSEGPRALARVSLRRVYCEASELETPAGVSTGEDSILSPPVELGPPEPVTVTDFVLPRARAPVDSGSSGPATHRVDEVPNESSENAPADMELGEGDPEDPMSNPPSEAARPIAAGPDPAGLPEAAGPVAADLPEAAGPVAADLPEAAGPVAADLPEAAGPLAADLPEAAGPPAMATESIPSVPAGWSEPLTLPPLPEPAMRKPKVPRFLAWLSGQGTDPSLPSPTWQGSTVQVQARGLHLREERPARTEGSGLGPDRPRGLAKTPDETILRGSVKRPTEAVRVLLRLHRAHRSGVLSWGDDWSLLWAEGEPRGARGPKALDALADRFSWIPGCGPVGPHVRAALLEAGQPWGLSPSELDIALSRILEEMLGAFVNHRGLWHFDRGMPPVRGDELVPALPLQDRLAEAISEWVPLDRMLDDVRGALQVDSRRRLPRREREQRFMSLLTAHPMEEARRLAGLSRERAAALTLFWVGQGVARLEPNTPGDPEPSETGLLSNAMRPAPEPSADSSASAKGVPHRDLAELDSLSRLRRLVHLARTSDYFELLDVPIDADTGAVDRAHAFIRTLLPPADFSGAPGSEALAREVRTILDEARAVLRDPGTRDAYRSHRRSDERDR